MGPDSESRHSASKPEVSPPVQHGLASELDGCFNLVPADFIAGDYYCLLAPFRFFHLNYKSFKNFRLHITERAMIWVKIGFFGRSFSGFFFIRLNPDKLWCSTDFSA